MKITVQTESKKIEAIAETLAKELNEGYSDNVLKYMEFFSKFHKYSRNNVILIRAQRPHASKVASFKAWKKVGRNIKKGEKGIAIFVPMIKKELVKSKDGEMLDNKFCGFRIGYVFDVSQTEGEDIPQFFHPMGDDYQELYLKLKTLIEGKGIKVLEVKGLGTCQGLSKGGEININSEIDGSNKFLTLIHEYAHELLHKTDDTRNLPVETKELQAEATTYIVAKYLGLESPVSKDYLKNWKATPKTLMEELNLIFKASQTIINLLSEEESVSKLTNEIKGAA